MKHFIVYAHPNTKSFCRAIVDKILDVLEMNGEEATVSNLYEMEFNPVLGHRDFEAIAQGTTLQDVEDEQRLIEWADQITFIYPIWWTGMPAIMKGYIDRVFTYDFAYRMTEHGAEGLLSGKKVKIINTMGTPCPAAWGFLVPQASVDCWGQSRCHAVVMLAQIWVVSAIRDCGKT